MLTEPNLDKSVIHSAIEDNYGVKIQFLSFIQGGEASWGYKVETVDGKLFFFKIHEKLTEYKKRFELTYRLYTDCSIQTISHPIKTRKGELVVFIASYPSALFNFISNSNAAQKPLAEKQRYQLGELLGKIHLAKNLIGDFSLREDFIYGNTDRLLKAIKAAPDFLKNESEFKQQTAELLLENEKRITAKLHELQILGNTLRKQKLDFVICHGEPHPWNTMTDEKGKVYLIDWDSSFFAPKEKDLNFIKEDQSKLDGYRNIVGSFSINEEVISYYNLEWTISEVDDWSNSLFYSKVNYLQNKHFLEEFESNLNELN